MSGAKSKLKISIVTVVLNAADVIAETVRSVLDQHDPELEYWIIDGGSTDGTLEQLAPFREQLAGVISEPDHGIYEAMNKGIRRCTGEVIGLLNAGDRYLPGALALVRRTFQEQGLVRTIFWGDVQYEFQGRVRGFRSRKVKLGAFAPHPSMFVPRQVYREIGLYDESLRLLGDYDFMYRAVNVEHLRVLYVPELVAFYREGGLSDRRRHDCLREELQVKLRYGQPRWWATLLYLLKRLKNRNRRRRR